MFGWGDTEKSVKMGKLIKELSQRISMEHIDIHNISKRLESVKKEIRNSKMSERQQKQIEQFILDCRIGKNGQKVNEHRLTSYLLFLLKLHEYFRKDLDTITEAEATKFYTDLQDNKITKQNKLPYAEETKNLFVRTLKKYLNWAFKGRDNDRYRETAKWMREGTEKSKKKAITFEQAETILSKEAEARNKAFFMFLFDSGARIEEALNVHKSDLEVIKRKKGGEYYKVHLKGTKTELADRQISLPLVTRYLNAWLKEHPLKDKNDFQIFPIAYDNARKIIRLMTTKVLGFSLSPHELRHSSATHYSNIIGDRSAFFHRFGWKYNSEVALGYLHRDKLNGDIGQEEIVKVVEAGRVERLEEAQEIMEKVLYAIGKALKENKSNPALREALKKVDINSLVRKG